MTVRLVRLRERIPGTSLLRRWSVGGICSRDGNGLDCNSWLTDGVDHLSGLFGGHLLVQLVNVVIDDDIGVCERGQAMHDRQKKKKITHRS